MTNPFEQYVSALNVNKTPQSEPIPGSGQVPNNAGGYAFPVSIWTQLDRFLMLGTVGGTYYVGQREITREAIAVVQSCLTADAARAVGRITQISLEGRAPSNDPAIVALSIALNSSDQPTRTHAYAAITRICRTSTHLFHLLELISVSGRGWGRGLRNAIGRWYTSKTNDNLAYQLVKYRQRDGWTHRDALRLSHPRTSDPVRGALFRWAATRGTNPAARVLVDKKTGRERSYPSVETIELPRIMNAYGSLSDDSHEETVVATILDVNLPREAVPTKFLKSPRIWEALLQKMPPEAMIRNLGNMTKIDCLKPMNDATNLVRNRLTDQVVLQKARIHPIDVLVAMKTYASGRGLMGKGTWSPIQTIVDALDRAFYLAFKAVEPTGKRIMLALDISGSMQHPAGGLPISCREAVAAIAMVTAAVEPNHYIVGFTSGNRPSRWTTMSRAHANLGSGLTELKISPSQRLDHVVNYIAAFPMGGTDCSLPMIHALERKLDVDAFVVLTDNETWHGEIHPMQALRQYRQERNIDSKLVVVAMTPEKFSIADPTDAGSLDVVGFDSATPALISEFIR